MLKAVSTQGASGLYRRWGPDTPQRDGDCLGASCLLTPPRLTTSAGDVYNVRVHEQCIMYTRTCTLYNAISISMYLCSGVKFSKRNFSCDMEKLKQIFKMAAGLCFPVSSTESFIRFEM